MPGWCKQYEKDETHKPSRYMKTHYWESKNRDRLHLTPA